MDIMAALKRSLEITKKKSVGRSVLRARTRHVQPSLTSETRNYCVHRGTRTFPKRIMNRTVAAQTASKALLAAVTWDHHPTSPVLKANHDRSGYHNDRITKTVVECLYEAS